MKNTLSSLSSLLIGAIALFTYADSYAAPVTVMGLGIHYGGNVQYTYRVTNNTQTGEITEFSVGKEGDNPNDDVAELTLYPLNSYNGSPNTYGDQIGTSQRLGGVFNTPSGWGVTIQGYEESNYFSLDWLRDYPNSTGMLPGQTLTFGVTVPPKYKLGDTHTFLNQSYLLGHFTASFGSDPGIPGVPPSGEYTGLITKLDTTPPVLSFTLNPAATAAIQRGQMVAINALISVTDDYDPAPEIKLESITSNETLGAADVQGASLGTDDRNFSVLATSYLPVGRVYVITYSATDASGNTAKQYVFLKVN